MSDSTPIPPESGLSKRNRAAEKILRPGWWKKAGAFVTLLAAVGGVVATVLGGAFHAGTNLAINQSNLATVDAKHTARENEIDARHTAAEILLTQQYSQLTLQSQQNGRKLDEASNKLDRVSESLWRLEGAAGVRPLSQQAPNYRNVN